MMRCCKSRAVSCGLVFYHNKISYMLSLVSYIVLDSSLSPHNHLIGRKSTLSTQWSHIQSVSTCYNDHPMFLQYVYHTTLSSFRMFNQERFVTRRVLSATPWTWQDVWSITQPQSRSLVPRHSAFVIAGAELYSLPAIAASS